MPLQIRQIVIVNLFAMLLALVACQPQADTELPTLAVTSAPENPQVDAASETPVPVEATEVLATSTSRPRPPTWTPSPEAQGSTDQSGTEPTPIDVGPVQPTLDPNATEPPTLAPFATLEVCGGFGEDITQNKRTFTIGTAPTIYWTPVQGAAQYQITLRDEFGLELIVEYIAGTTHTFAADLFELDVRYGWEAYPIDNLGQQMCFSRGAELFPQR